MALNKLLQQGQDFYNKVRKKTIVQNYTPQITSAHVVVHSFCNTCSQFYSNPKKPPSYFVKENILLKEIQRITPLIEDFLNPYSSIAQGEKAEDILQKGLAQLRKKRRDTSLIAEVMLTKGALSGCTYTIYDDRTLPKYIEEFAQATAYPLVFQPVILDEWEEPSTETLSALEQRLFS